MKKSFKIIGAIIAFIGVVVVLIFALQEDKKEVDKDKEDSGEKEEKKEEKDGEKEEKKKK